ncbi:uncharacterized protein V6R79_013264 [Siganus canaliculatus]
MGSRRATRSIFGNGRSSNGEDTNGNSRPSSCSYLSNVRPENRSTLCSMMAQLTEETQPSFETTLKSKAVSENCNVKFSCVVTGHPAPQVTWYKDDMQLDRYCGLPKYEIFRNGKNHSLHIFNCTVEDAAIYQASASNTKGIVSCSGVLEVGEMNEFKIHQRYFAKLKQKADTRRREAEGKENQEPLRTISPDRTQRKRRSTMEAFLSPPSSMETEDNETNHQDVAAEAGSRLLEATVEDMTEKPVPITNGAGCAVSNGQVMSENAEKGGTYVYDSAQKIFTALEPKTPFVKKKIKISNRAKTVKSGPPAEERKDMTALVCTEQAQSEGNSEEVMEVENAASSSHVDSNPINVAEHPSSKTEDLLYIRKPLNDGNLCAEVTVPSQKDQLTTSPPPVSPPMKHTVSANVGTQAKRPEKETEGEKPKQSLHVASTQLKTSATPVASKQPVNKAKDSPKTQSFTVKDEDSNASTGASLAHRDSSCKGLTAFPQPECEQAADQLSEKEASPCLKNASVSQPAPQSEVTQVYTETGRNDAPVDREPSLTQCVMDIQPPQRAPSMRDTSADDVQTPALNGGLHAAVGKMTQDTQDHSRGLNESHTALFTDLQKSPLESPSGGENTRGSNVSASAEPSQEDAAMKMAGETEIQVAEKVNGIQVGESLMQCESLTPNEKVVEMETESAAVLLTDLQTIKGTADTHSDVVFMGTFDKKPDKNERVLKTKEEARPEMHNLKSNIPEPAADPPRKKTENMSELQETKFQEIHKPTTKVISIAELLRSQIKALDSALTDSVTTALLHTDPQDLNTASTETQKESKDGDSKCQVKVTQSEKRSERNVDDTPPRNIKETLMEIYQQLNKTDQEPIQTQSLEKPLIVPPISVVDSGSPPETAGLHGGGRKYNEGLLDIGKETGASETTPPLTVKPATVSAQRENINVLQNDKDEPVRDKDVVAPRQPSPQMKADSGTEKGTSGSFLDHTSFLQQKSPDISQLFSDTQEINIKLIQPDSSIYEGLLRTESFSKATPEVSPVLKRRNCVSPIPSATAQELASGARRKILTPKAKPEEASEATSPFDNRTQKKEVSTQNNKLSASPVSLSTSPSLSRRSPPVQPPGEQTSAERRSPFLSRRKLETTAPNLQPAEEINSPKPEPAEKDKHDPFKAPQVIRKIRGEAFGDASGHLKIWCQFFNVLSESRVTWYRNDIEISQVKRNAGDESPVNLAIVQASSKDSGVYRCSITNEYGTDATDCLLSSEILAGMSLREDLGVGEEIEMTPMIFNKGVADSGVWGNKLFGRVMMQESHIGDGCSHKVWRAKVIYGLEPVFDSGHTCIIKACNPIAYEGKGESCLIERNLDIVRQECKIQNLAREYCKIFSAEARVIEHFGFSLEVIPVYLMYRPANTVPYATVEADLTGEYQKYSVLDHTGRMQAKSGSEVEQKCCALQHWIFQWTNGNLLLTRLEGADTKITNIGISVKSTGHQGLSLEGNPKVFEQFIAQHQCNYFCGLLSLRSLKVMDSLLTPAKPKGSKSPLLQRKMAAGSSSPQSVRKAAGSPRLSRKTEQDGRSTPTKPKAADAPKAVKME